MKKNAIAWCAAAALLAGMCARAWAEGGSANPLPDQAPSLVVSESDNSLVCRDADGNPVRLAKHPKRVIVNFTSLVGIWYQAGGIAVGMPDTVSREEVPEAARGIATTGKSTEPNIERILALAPDLVILSSTSEKQRALSELLRENSVPFVLLRYETYDDYVGLLDLFMRLNGRSIVTDAPALTMVRQINALITQCRSLSAPRFLSLFASVREVQAETSRAHTAFIATALGGRNIVPEIADMGGPSRVRLSMERITMADPDVILVTTMGNPAAVQNKMKETLMGSDMWQGLRAVKTGRVYFLPNEYFLYKPNERFAEAFTLLAEALHPEEKWR